MALVAVSSGRCLAGADTYYERQTCCLGHSGVHLHIGPPVRLQVPGQVSAFPDEVPRAATSSGLGACTLPRHIEPDERPASEPLRPSGAHQLNLRRLLFCQIRNAVCSTRSFDRSLLSLSYFFSPLLITGLRDACKPADEFLCAVWRSPFQLVSARLH